MSRTGDATGGAAVSVAAVVHSFPIVERADLIDEDNPINDTRESGKTPGGMVMAKNGAIHTLVTAKGEGKNDPWVLVGTAAEVVYVTPA